MEPPDGFKIAKRPSATLASKNEELSNGLSSSLEVLDISIASVAYPKGAVLFMEGQPARGIFAICSGRVKLSTSSIEGKAIILRIAEAGELVGLPSTLSGRPYEVSAEVSEPALVNFTPRGSFLRFLRANPRAVIQVAQLLTDSHYERHELIQSLGLSRSVSEKLARFFLGWSDNYAHGEDHLRIALTQAEIGEVIGVTRETVTRLLGVFKKRKLLTVKGATVNICNRAALQVMAGS